jgi:hypothetical protein
MTELIWEGKYVDGKRQMPRCMNIAIPLDYEVVVL